jgi:predicted GNAT family N-acyltransferase
MNDLIFRKIFYNTPEYLEALTIRKEVFVKEQNVPEEIEIDEFECNSHHFLLTQASVPVACGRMRLKSPYIKFERIAGLKSYRGMGLGRVLMENMQEFARLHYPELTPYMHSQVDAVPFYEKLGWTRQGEIFFEAGIPHQAMTLT